MSKLSKRAIPLLIVALMVLSIVTVMPINAIDPGITISDENYVLDYDGQYGDTMIVEGSGVTAGVDVNIYWDAVKAWDGEKGLLNSSEAKASGDFEVWFDVPEAVNGWHYIWVKDTDTGDTAVAPDFWVDASIELSPSSGLAGDKITINGYGFSDEEDIDEVIFDNLNHYAPVIVVTTPTVPETDSLGSWEATFKVPDGARPYWDTYEVYADDDLAVSATVDFKLGASISFDISKGPVGTIVEVKGRGFDKDEFIGDVANEVTLDDGGAIPCYIFDTPVDVETDGEFTMDIVIPQVSKKNIKYVITVTDGVESATAKYNATALAKVTVDPEYGVQGSKISVEGTNFVQKSGEDVVVELWGLSGTPPVYQKQADVKTFETDSNGEFSGTFTVPAVSSGNYDLWAIQTDYNIDDDTTFRAGMIIVILSKTSGPSGTKVTMTGTGFTTGNDAWNATFGDLTLFDTGDVDDDGDLEGPPTFFVPSVDPGTYTIMVLDIPEEIEVDVEFTVTETTMVTTDPLVAPNEYNVSIEGKYFAEEEGTELDEVVLYNVTADGEIDEDWDITDEVLIGDPDAVPPTDAPVTIDEDGNFTGWWEVPDDEVLSLGDYWLNVTDEEGMFAQYMFTIVAKTVDIESRKDSFAIGDTVAFNIESSFAKYESYIEIMTPDGNLYWTTDLFTEGPPSSWIKVGTVMRVPYYEQSAGGNPMVLEDVPLGTWSWTWYDKKDDEIDSGTFTVTEAPADILAQQMTTLTEDFAGLTEDFSTLADDFAGLSTDVAGLASDVAAAAAAAQAANSAVANLAEVVGDIADIANSAKTSADSARTAAESAQTAAEDAGRAASGLTTLVYGAIGASLVAALAAIVSLMQISRRIAG